MGYADKMKRGYTMLRIGMSRAEVIKLFGKPNAESIRESVETLRWGRDEWRGMLRGGYVNRSVEVEIENGVVIAYKGNNIDMSAW